MAKCKLDNIDSKLLAEFRARFVSDDFSGAGVLLVFDALDSILREREQAQPVSVTDDSAVERALQAWFDGPGGFDKFKGLRSEAVYRRAMRRALIAAAPNAPTGDSLGLHPATANLVRRFAAALAEKLSAAERKYGYRDDWMRPDWMDECREHLREHLAKGDPRDVAAYCAFLWHHGESTAPAPAANLDDAMDAELKVLGWVYPTTADFDHIHRLYGDDTKPLVARIPAGGVPVYAAIARSEENV